MEKADINRQKCRGIHQINLWGSKGREIESVRRSEIKKTVILCREGNVYNKCYKHFNG